MTTPSPRLHPDTLADVDRVVIAGDWHNNVGAARAIVAAAAELDIHTIVHVGDFGIGPWPGEATTITSRLAKPLTQHDVAILVTPGNHENWDTIDKAPLDEHGRHIFGRHIRVLPRGHRWTMSTKVFASLGGAFSIDLGHRTPHTSWWPQEEITTADADDLIAGGPVDVLITHEVPEGTRVNARARLRPDLDTRSAVARGLIRQVVSATTPQLVFSGHWHQRVTDQLPHRNGWAQVHVLDREYTPGNAVILDILTGHVTPLPQTLAAHRARE